ncbi:MAG: GNAT family N-acetyltransferase [Anaerolineales bacterium]|jgi:ribosomal-protein-alanine N-acetyltransferase
MTEIKILPESNIAVLPAALRDFKAVYHLEKVCFGLDAWPMLDVLGVLTIPQVIRLKAMDQEQLIGFIAADLRRTQGVAWIATLAVLPEYRRQGIGKAILGICEEHIPLPLIRLSVRQSNQPAIELYLKAGYQQVDIWKKYYRGGEDALILEKVPGPGL